MSIAVSELSPPLAYARLLRENHELIEAGKGDGDEAEALADRMDGPWYAMTAQECKRMRGLSIDLYSIAEGGPKQVEMSEEEVAAWRLRLSEAYAQYETGNVDVILDLFRQPIPMDFPRERVRYLQARCWERLGDYETALTFMTEAERANPRFALFVLLILLNRGDTQRVREQANRLIDRPGASAAELYLSASGLLQSTREMSDEEAAPALRRALQVLARAESAASPLHDQTGLLLYRGLAATTGLCLERLGKVAAAIDTYSRALAKHPEEPELLTMRGVARYRQDPKAALEDFRRATQAGAVLAMPWFILARHSLLSGVYGEALRQALRAIERPGPAPLHAEAHETIAIALAMMAQPLTRVLEHFAKASELDPKNDRIRQNYELAQRSTPRRLKDWVGSTIAPTIDARAAREVWQVEFDARLSDLLVAA